jgi:hypothetical protein
MKFPIFMFLFIFVVSFQLFPQGTDWIENNSYVFSEKEINSGFAFEQLQYLMENSRYCISEKQLTRPYLQRLGINEIPEGTVGALIDYQRQFTQFLLLGSKSSLLIVFSNLGEVRISGVYFRDSPVNRNRIINELTNWERENNVIIKR